MAPKKAGGGILDIEKQVRLQAAREKESRDTTW